MSTTFHQVLGRQVGRPPHRSRLEISCAHGGVGSQVRLINADALPPDVAKRRALEILHAQIHQLVKRHGDRWRCDCARPVFVLCWQYIEKATAVGSFAGGDGGSRS